MRDALSGVTVGVVSTSAAAVTIRPRHPDDLPELARVLFAQQAETRYPVRDPLPIPVAEFLHAEDAAAAWTAEHEGRVVGHVCRTGPVHGYAEADAMNTACAEAYGCTVAELAWVSTLFVDPATRGLGVGRALLATVVDDIAARGLRPCLEVLDLHGAAGRLYRSTGWVDVLRTRPAWLAGAVDDPEVGVSTMVLPDAGQPPITSARS